MMRVACKLAEKYNIDSVTTGESIGQVASQTMDGLIVSDNCAVDQHLDHLLQWIKLI